MTALDIAALRAMLEALNDPAYAPLLEALTETCPDTDEGRCPVRMRAEDADSAGDEEYAVDCPDCHGTGRRVRDVSGWPKGALCGAVGAALDPIFQVVCQAETFVLWRTVRDNVECYDDEAALRSLLAALPEVKADA